MIHKRVQLFGVECVRFFFVHFSFIHSPLRHLPDVNHNSGGGGKENDSTTWVTKRKTDFLSKIRPTFSFFSFAYSSRVESDPSSV